MIKLKQGGCHYRKCCSYDRGVLKPYYPEVFQDLSDFPEARLQLKNCRNAISSLGAIICRYRFQDAIGINLLHKHFDIADNEIIVSSMWENHSERKRD